MVKTRQPSNDPVTEFWRWFVATESPLKALYSAGQFEPLAEQMNRELDRVDPGLAWEIGAGRTRPYLLTISGEGNLELREKAERLLERAPRLKDWEFYSSRPARVAPAAVRLPESGQRFETSTWTFVPSERSDEGRLDLVIVDEHLARSGRESALKAVSIYLDQLLGEDTVEAWIGMVSIENPAAVRVKKLFKMAELPDYLLWVTHRDKSPLRKASDR